MTPHQIIAQYTHLAFDEDNSLKHDLKFDDVDLAGIAHTIWEEYGIDIPGSEVERRATVGDVFGSVERRVCV